MTAIHIWTAIMPIIVRSEPNERCHWAEKAARAKRQRETAYTLARKAIPLPCVVELVRLIPRGGKAYDTDNLIAGCKAARDGIADKLGIRDNDPRVEWRYGQESSKSVGLRVTITSEIEAQP